MRMIDADALKNSIDEHVYLVHHGFNETEYGCTQYGIHQIIDDAPTIDAVPIEWILKNERLPKEGKGHDAIMDMIADWKEKEEPVRHGKWIPVSERPVIDGQYIVTLIDGTGLFTDIAEWNSTFGGRWRSLFVDDDDYAELYDINNVVAWMPLPKPYEVNNE